MDRRRLEQIERYVAGFFQATSLGLNRVDADESAVMPHPPKSAP